MAHGNDSNTVLLIHSHNTSNTQLFADDSFAGNGGSGHTITPVGTIKHSNAVLKPNLGASTVFMLGDISYLSVPFHDDFSFGSGDFGIEFWFYPTDVAGFNVGLVSMYVDANNYFGIELNGDRLRFNSKTSGSSILSSTYLLSNNLIINTWYHTAIIRNGNTMSLYMDGVLKQSATVVSNPLSYSVPLHIGFKTSSHSFHGYLTELRISKGVVRTDFPPSFPYTSASRYVAGSASSTSLVSNSDTTSSAVVIATTTSSTQNTEVLPSVANSVDTGLWLVQATPILSNAVIPLSSTSGVANFVSLSSHSVFGSESSGWSVSNSIVINRSASQSQSSLGIAQNYELTTQELAGSIFLTNGFQGQLNDGENFTTSLGLLIKSTPTISSTARRNIVLKLREDLYGEIRIDDFTSEVTQVEGTTDFRGVLTEDQVSSTPSVFVMRLRTQATNNATLGYDVRQQVEDYFGILLVADNISDEYGVNSMDVIWAMHSKIIDSLLGWQLPTTEFDRPTMPLAYRGGVAYGLELDSYHWLDQFSCTSQICSYRNQVKPVTF